MRPRRRTETFGDCRSYQINLNATAQKDRETSADAFAANAIRTASEMTGTDAGLVAAQIAMTLSQVSWNLGAHLLLDDF
jgi:hypothetical protein